LGSEKFWGYLLPTPVTYLLLPIFNITSTHIATNHLLTCIAISMLIYNTEHLQYIFKGKELHEKEKNNIQQSKVTKTH